MSERYIDPEWLKFVHDATFFYPSADSDHVEPIEILQDSVKSFVFCDIGYPPDLNLKPAIGSTGGVRLIDRHTEGSLGAILERRTDQNGRPYRFLSPSKLIETYERPGGTLTVVRRRGFGQIALSTEFAERSISIFMHRGDSPGEGGSNVYFFSNKNARYEPCGRLFDKLARRLTDRSLVITDGSNASFSNLRKYHGSKTAGCDAFRFHQDQGTRYTRGGFQWSCVGWLSNRNGPTLVWGLTRQTT